MKSSEDARKLLPPSPREGNRKAVVGVSKVGTGNTFDCICKGTSSQTTIQQYPTSYLRHTPSRLRRQPPQRGGLDSLDFR